MISCTYSSVMTREWFLATRGLIHQSNCDNGGIEGVMVLGYDKYMVSGDIYRYWNGFCTRNRKNNENINWNRH